MKCTILTLVLTAYAIAQTQTPSAVDYICAVVISPPGTGNRPTQSPLTCMTPAKLAAVLVAAAPQLFSGSGIPGPAGPQGPVGLTGPQGTQGPQGAAAIAGSPTVTCPDPTTPCLVGVVTQPGASPTYIPVIAAGTVQLANMQNPVGVTGPGNPVPAVVGMIADEPASAMNVAPPTAPGPCPPSNIADPNYVIWATDNAFLYVGLRTATGACQWARAALATAW